MRIKFPEKRDARAWKGMSGHAGDFIDLDTGETIGHLEIHEGFWIGDMRSHTRSVSLLNGKYNATFNSHEECCAFAKGVIAVINHVAVPEPRKSTSQAA